jgi:hypothetical protein
MGDHDGERKSLAGSVARAVDFGREGHLAAERKVVNDVKT